MTLPLPGSMNYLMNGGVLDFDANAYLNSGIVTPYYQPMLNGAKIQPQPQKDSFSSKLKNNEKTIKTVAATVILGALAFVGIKKSKNLLKGAKDSKFVSKIGDTFKSAKEWIKSIPSKISNILPKKEAMKEGANKAVDAAKDVAGKVADKAKDAGSAVKDVAAKAVDKAKDVAEAATK